MKSQDAAPHREANWLISALGPAAFSKVSELTEVFEATAGDTLWEPEKPIEHVYFPQSGCLSVIIGLDEGQQVEVGTIGWEGMAGLPLLHGVKKSTTKCIAQIDGTVKRIKATDFGRALSTHSDLLAVMHRYAQYWSEQSARSIACNGVHSIEQRCARWLLMTHDRVASDVLPLRHEFLAIMLGVRRASVSVAAAALQSAGLISYSRGKVTVRDHAGLVQASCGCYSAIQNSYSQLLPMAGSRARGGRH